MSSCAKMLLLLLCLPLSAASDCFPDVSVDKSGAVAICDGGSILEYEKCKDHIDSLEPVHEPHMCFRKKGLNEAKLVRADGGRNVTQDCTRVFNILMGKNAKNSSCDKLVGEKGEKFTPGSTIVTFGKISLRHDSGLKGTFEYYIGKMKKTDTMSTLKIKGATEPEVLPVTAKYTSDGKHAFIYLTLVSFPADYRARQAEKHVRNALHCPFATVSCGSNVTDYIVKGLDGYNVDTTVLLSYWEETGTDAINPRANQTYRCTKIYQMLKSMTSSLYSITYDVQLRCLPDTKRVKDPFVDQYTAQDKWLGPLSVSATFAAIFLCISATGLFLSAFVVGCCPHGWNPKGKVFFAKNVKREEARKEKQREKEGYLSYGARAKAKMMGLMQSARQSVSSRAPRKRSRSS